MSAISQCRCLAGHSAFGQVRPSRRALAVSNGAKWFMRRKDSYMVEVQVGEDESEDYAVRRFMKSVVQSGVINKLRARRHKESKIETYKRKLQERAQARRMGLLDPTWEEFYGEDGEPKPFEDFFAKDEEEEIDIYLSDMGDVDLLGDGAAFYAPLPSPYGEVMADEVFDLAAYERQPGAGTYGYTDAAGSGGYVYTDDLQ